MDKVLATSNDPYFHTIEHWVGSSQEGILNPDEFKECNGLDKNYMMGIYCLLHKNLMSESTIHLEKSTSSDALYILGRLYYGSKCGFEFNSEKGMEYLNKAYTEGNLDAGFSLARIFYYGDSYFAQSYHAAQYICDDLASKSYDQKCTSKRTGFHSIRAGIAYGLEEYEKVIELVKTASENGCTCCYNELGVMYSMGKHFQQDEKKAFELFKKVDMTKCYSKCLYWNMARSYHIFGDYKTSIKYLVMATKYYDLKHCYDQIRSVIVSYPDAILNIIKDGVLVIDKLKS